MNSEIEDRRRDILELASAYDLGFEHRETIYLIESPSPEDLLHGRNEGDALSRILRLAEIDVVYYLCATLDAVDIALGDIADKIIVLGDPVAMPIIHISAHGSELGLELTDGDTIYWEQLDKRLERLNQIIGYVDVPKAFRQNIPKILICLSSCGAYKNYPKRPECNLFFQGLIGPLIDVGWCQALVAFSAFYYNAFINEQSYDESARRMNKSIGAEGSETFGFFVPNDNPLA